MGSRPEYVVQAHPHVQTGAEVVWMPAENPTPSPVPDHESGIGREWNHAPTAVPTHFAQAREDSARAHQVLMAAWGEPNTNLPDVPVITEKRRDPKEVGTDILADLHARLGIDAEAVAEMRANREAKD